jgi:hypothetical protein
MILLIIGILLPLLVVTSSKPIENKSSTNVYSKRIDKLLETATDDKEAIESLQAQIERLYQKRDKLKGYARAEVTQQIAIMGKHATAFEQAHNNL